MGELSKEEEVYAAGLAKILTDSGTRAALEKDPAGTLEGLGFKLDDKARAHIAGPGDHPELGEMAFTSPLVRVVTGGTRPAVSVVVQSSTVGTTGGKGKKG